MKSEKVRLKKLRFFFFFVSSFALSLFLILSDLRSLKIEQQQIYTLLKHLLSLIVRKIFRDLSRFGFGLFPNYELSVTSLLSLTFSIERR